MYISAECLDELLYKTYTELLKPNTKISPSRGSAVEIIGATLELKNPRARLSITEGRSPLFSCLGEFLWYLSGSNQLNFINYYIKNYDENSDDGLTVHGAYGPRICGKKQETAQLTRIIDILKNKRDSRQAIIQIFDATDLLQKHKDIPCTCTLQFFKRENKIHLVVNMRSNDAFLGLPHDIFSFTMFQEIVACHLNCDLGTYKHFVGSLHLYDSNKEHVQKYLNEGIQQSIYKMPCMPNADIQKQLEALLKAEEEIRTNQSLFLKEINEHYWNDLILLLSFFNKLKNKASLEELSNICGCLHHSIYKHYANEKIRKLVLNTQKKNKIVTLRERERKIERIIKEAGKVLDQKMLSPTIINWGAPIVSFGNLSNSTIATLGLNPSNREFMDSTHVEITGTERRFPTLNSLNLKQWGNLSDEQTNIIYHSCKNYFTQNPYDLWFKPLNFIIEGTSTSFYDQKFPACHLDLIPFATLQKWGNLKIAEQGYLLTQYGHFLGDLIKSSSLHLIVLNGQTVVKTLKRISDWEVKEEEVSSWKLNRKSGKHIAGIKYTGILSKIAGIDLNRKIYVFGYNHNIQSSFGITNKIKQSIKKELTNYYKEIMK